MGKKYFVSVKSCSSLRHTNELIFLKIFVFLIRLPNLALMSLARNNEASEKKDLRMLGRLSIIVPCVADVAQLVEHDLAKVGVAGSNPVVRSIVIFGRSDFHV